MPARLLLLVCCVTAGGCEAGRRELPPTIALTGRTMGTTYTVKIPSLPSGTPRELLQRDIGASLEQVDRLMSTYRPDSEVSRFNRWRDEAWFDVSAPTAEVVDEALTLAEATGGAFDPTVGPLVSLWNFGSGRRRVDLPTEEQIADARRYVGYDKLQVRLQPPGLRKRVRELQLDLSAIAKGYAVDRLAQLLERRGVAAFLVEVGGETRARGRKLDGNPWRLGIEAPRETGRAIWRVLDITDASVATSGDYRNFYQRNGHRYAHVIDPRSGAPTAHQLTSASVVDRRCSRADALATALLVLGPEEGFRFAVSHDVAALLLVRQEDGLVERATPAFLDVQQHQTLADAEP